MAQRGRSTGRQPGRPGTRFSGAGRPERPSAPLPRATSAQIAALREVTESAVVGVGYELEAFSVKPAGRRHQVRVVIDGDGDLGLDAIADVSRAISQALDAAEASGKQLIDSEYQLEVSSPGVDRPLTLPKHWWRNTGRTVKVKAGEKTVTGRIVAANDQGVTLDVAGVSHRLGYEELGPGRVQIEFSRLEEVSDEDLEEFEDLEGEDEDLDERLSADALRHSREDDAEDEGER